ncbi:MAG TPA: ABC transporter permease, partial [Firmicutes bacterium]|nr:ABC transporter permease [Bacillota bacterium]
MSTQFLSFIKNRQKLGYLTKGILICVFLIFFIVCPIVFVFSQSLMNENGAFTFQNYVNAFSNEDTGKAIWDSLLLAISVTGLSTLIAVPEAYLLAKTRLRKLWWLDLILIIPFMVPPYINSMGWMLFMQRNGILWRNLPFLRPLASSFYSFFGMVWIMSMHTSPFLMTMLKSAFLSFPKSLDDANDVYQKSRIKRFFKVYMPILLPNFFIGAFLVFVKALSEYGTPATFGPAIGVF